VHSFKFEVLYTQVLQNVSDRFYKVV